ncbi:hypothetical protein VTK56DRAFT_1878 [Thermocarpiscus australiensis]
MDPQSPPKRVTRARAAAKTTEPATKTAAAKSRTGRNTTTTTTRTATKRKTRSDEPEDLDCGRDELDAVEMAPVAAMKPTRGRGRPKKAAAGELEPEPEPAPEPAPVRTRGRPRKVVEPAVEEPVKAARATRAKKAAPEEAADAAQLAKKTTRGRPGVSATATTTTTSTTKSLAKPAVKKTVKFEEPEKENIAPAGATSSKGSTKTSAPASAVGLRAKPVRKAAAATTRTARSAKAAAAPSEKEEKPLPLSPKKVSQLAMNRVESDDELGMDDDKVPVRRLKKVPIKPASGRTKSSTQAKAPVPVSDNDENAVVAQPEAELNLMLNTPAKRLPASPWKGSIKTPARRVEGLLGPLISQGPTDGPACQSPIKMGLLQSPAKRQPLNSNPLGAGSINGAQAGVSPLKMSLLSSPAKRPASPIKPLSFNTEQEEPVNQSPAPKPTLLASPAPAEARGDLKETGTVADEDMAVGHMEDNIVPESPSRLSFPGRLSAVLPRHADPTLTPPTLFQPEEKSQDEDQDAPAGEVAEENTNSAECPGESMVLDDPPLEAQAVESASTTPPSSPPKAANLMFELREKDLNPYYSASESESDGESPEKQGRYSSAFGVGPATPCPASTRTPNSRSDRVRSSGRSTAKRLRTDDKFGFTPLAEQLSGWAAGPSPLQTRSDTASSLTVADGQANAAIQVYEAAPAPVEAEQITFFEDEMHVRPDTMEVEENDDPVLEDIAFTEEDRALAAEAHDMSLMETEQADPGDQSNDDTLSDASQEYGDENQMPIDPILFSGSDQQATTVPPVTPQRVLRREFHTVAKVPLKPADDSTPMARTQKRRHSISRLPVARPSHRLTRNATVISYSPSKQDDTNGLEESREERAESAPPMTPQKSDVWSTIGTPARTPRPDVNPALLRGAVVFVDVHTSEGADASGIFVELLTQMGARCVKSWSWNPSSSQSESGAESRPGITHVVYKDGGKRTLEKVRESGGSVQCVGVSWVLDCERENQWLDEAPYYIDTSLVPRGGARRRKSMEPRAIANLNGMLVPTPVRNSRGCHTAPSTPANNRRASALWVRTPEEPRLDDDADDDDDDDDDGKWAAALSPVPKTPAPEAIARFAANISPGSTSTSSVGGLDTEDDPLSRDDDDDEYGRRRQEMLLRTCPPPKRTAFVELGERILSKEKDERVLMRLMAARRKSLQFAPKVGSPLAKSWK